MFFWRPVLAGLLTFSEVEQISFIDLVHAHEMCDIKDKMKLSLMEGLGGLLG